MPNKIKTFKPKTPGKVFKPKTDVTEFYNSRIWRELSASHKRNNPLCVRCGRIKGNMVCHHKIHIDTPEGWASRLSDAGLDTYCLHCHNAIHGGQNKNE